MKQLILNYRSGDLRVSEVPAPQVQPGTVLVRNVCSVASVGTERYVIGFAEKGLLQKALARPDLARQVITKVRTEGLQEAYRAAMGRLDTPAPLGYSSAGMVAEVGPRASGLSVGDRVACSGSGYALHAEFALVPRGLCFPIPTDVTFEQAAFVTLGGIVLHSVRTAEVRLGDRVAVIGLGPLGQLTVQVLKAAGCRVLGIDVDAQRVDQAQTLGADMGVTASDEVSTAAHLFSDGQGVDAVIICAHSADSKPVRLAAEIVRQRGRIVAPGTAKLNLPRKTFFEKEIAFTVSRHAGPGSQDPQYELGEQDYPIGEVRWTERRNLSAFLDLVQQGHVTPEKLISHRYPIERGTEAYQLITGKDSGPFMGVVLTYGEGEKTAVTTVHRNTSITPGKVAPRPAAAPGETLNIGLIGGGVFARSTLLPILKGMKTVRLRGVATATSLSAAHLGKKYRFDYATTSYQEVLADPAVECVLIVTRHGSHASQVADALRGGKHVFVEKPLAITPEQLCAVTEVALQPGAPLVMVGFNRRFSPAAIQMEQWFQGVAQPLTIHCRVNAGPLPADSWVHRPDESGGRIIGEVCHFVDLVQFLARSLPVRVHAEGPKGAGYQPEENVVATLTMENGAIATITYVAGGDKAFSRERIEVFGGGAVGVIDNFRSAAFTRSGKRRHMRAWSVDRGHRGELEAFFRASRQGGPAPMPFNDYVMTTLTTFAIVESLKRGAPVDVNPQAFGLKL